MSGFSPGFERRWLCLVLLGVASFGCGPSGTPGGVTSDVGAGDVQSDGVIGDVAPATTCTPACLLGYVCLQPSPSLDARCVVDPARACQPCVADAQCLGGACAAVGGDGTFCLIPCDPATSACPTGYGCVPRGDGHVCAPAANSCTCLPQTVGTERGCEASAAATCGGVQACAASGWQPCVARPVEKERCNGVDDDCDGETDEEGVPTTPCTTTNAAGSCSGSWRCDGAAGLACDAATPIAELCDDLDNNCDGDTDEPWRKGKWTISDVHCGVCGNACGGAFENGTGVCDPTTAPPHCTLASCKGGWLPGPAGQCVAIPPDPCGACTDVGQCALGMACVAAPKGSGVPGEKVCAAACAGGCDVGFTCETTTNGQRCLPAADVCSCTAKVVGVKRTCTTTNDLGACAGIQGCEAGGWSSCSAPTPAVDACNGVDDDCDGATDEAAGAGDACTAKNSHGTCDGKLVCQGGAGLSCDAATPSADVCNGQDDNCDGQVDEGALDPATGLYLSPLHCGKCDNVCPSGFGPHAAPSCTAKGKTAACGMACEAGWVDVNHAGWDGCECKFLSTDDSPDGVDRNCDGVDGNAADAIFVATTGSDAWPGTRAKPTKTVARGVQLATQLGKRDVYIEGGSYLGNLQLAAGVRIYGGFATGFAKRNAKTWNTVLLGAPQGTGDAITVRCIGIAGAGAKTRLDGVTITAADAPSGSSYGVWSAGCDARVSLVDLNINAGDGGAGAAGFEAGDGSFGYSGLAGHNAKDINHSGGCKASDHNPGGARGQRICQGIDVSGGGGGTAICPDYHDKISAPACPVDADWSQTTDAIEPGGAGKGPAGGAGGTAGADSYIDRSNGLTTQCKASYYGCIKCETGKHKTTGASGADGASGTAGAPGVAGSAAGSLKSGRFSPLTSSGGGAGGHGSGGGGGGAAGGVEVHGCTQQSGRDDIGGSGGGGGSGGCGGVGGSGGQGGGGSFALWIIAAPSGIPTAQGLILRGGSGGAGGQGGPGGLGGYGGFGGKGGLSAAGAGKTFCTSKGGSGGSGGNGGHGGGGAGGAGGPAWPLVGVGMSQASLDGFAKGVLIEKTGSGGTGGAGGSSAGKAGAPGPTGEAKAIRSF